VGGRCNASIGNCSFIGGGKENRACGIFSTVSGGYNNRASGSNSTVSGGYNNLASGNCSFIGVGANNTASGCYSVVSGGASNTASGPWSSIGGGCINTASGLLSKVGGGIKNTAQAIQGTIGGGNCNFVCNSTSGCCALGATVAGGVGNNTGGGTFALSACTFTVAPAVVCTAGQFSFIGGGFQNRARGSYSTIGGGINNSADSNATVGGGCGNISCGNNSFIGGGYGNTACGSNSTVIGGQSNGTFSSYSVISGGQSNQTCGAYSSISGGFCGCAGIRGQRTYSVTPFAALGDAQHSQWILSNCSTSTTPVTLYIDGTTASVSLTVPTGKAYFCIINIAGIAVDGSASQFAHFIRKVAIKNNIGTTELLGAVTTIGTDTGTGGYAVAITADNGNDSLKISVTGGTTTNLRWMATVDAVDIGFTSTQP
jgi:hypothetical protein